MPIVTQLKPQKNGKRVNVYLDYEFAFGIDLDNLVKYGIKIEKQFSQEEIAKIVRDAEFQKSLDKLFRFAMTRPRSAKEIRDWFRRKEIAPELHEELFGKLRKLDLQDDLAFAKWWVGQRLQFRPKGKLALQQELSQKGIDRKIIEEVLSEQDVDEVSLAKEVIKRNATKWDRFDKLKKVQKMTEFLLRRGFSWEVVKEALKE